MASGHPDQEPERLQELEGRVPRAPHGTEILGRVRLAAGLRGGGVDAQSGHDLSGAPRGLVWPLEWFRACESRAWGIQDAAGTRQCRGVWIFHIFPRKQPVSWFQPSPRYAGEQAKTLGPVRVPGSN